MAFELPRRSFIKGLVSLIAAPAIVRASSLMPVKALDAQFTSSYQYLKPLAASFVQTKEIVAANIFNACELRDFLLPGLYEVNWQYKMWPPEGWERLFSE